MPFELNTLHEDMLAAISDRYQKTVGFPAYDFTLAFALACLSLDQDIALAEAHLDVDNLTGVELDDYILQHRGLTRKYATYATATLRVVTGSGTIQAGDLFATDSGVEFFAISDGIYTQGDTFPVRSYTAGNLGNVGPDTITYMPVTIAGIAAVTNDQAASGGYEGESDSDFRDRYYEDLRNPNNGSNQQAYLAWALSVPGVGRAKVFPLAYGANTVEVCIVDANMEPAGPTLIGEVQDLIDPNQNGDGSGQAPLGAICTVTTATILPISVSTTVTMAAGYTAEQVNASIRATLIDYLREIAFDKGVTYVSYTQLSRRVSVAEGVLDHTGMKVNGGVANVALTDRQTPVLGEVTVT